MDYEEIIKNFLSSPTETLKTEIKEWIDINIDEEKAKLVKSCTALFNNNGGFIAIGFKNEDGAPTIKQNQTRGEVQKIFNFDAIQKIVSRYSSTSIETTLIFREINGAYYPFIFIPPGVQSPAFIKADLHHPETNKKLLQQGKLYIRTISSNGTVSTSEPKTQKDWDRLLNICLENKERDIAKFFQNNLTEGQLQKLKDFFSIPRDENEIKKKNIFDVKEILEYGYKEYKATAATKSLPRHGSFQVAFTTNNNTPKLKISQTLLQILNSSNPRPSGWPLWVILQNSPDEDKKPKHYTDRWQAFIDGSNNLDFWIVTENQCFYHYRALSDDICGSTTQQAKAAKLNEIDAVWQIQYICDSIATGLAFAQALNNDEKTVLSFAFKWTGLNNRFLTAWAHPDRFLECKTKANIDDTAYEVNIPINATRENIVNYTYEIASHLFLTFGGFDRISRDTVAEIVINYLKWK